MRGRPGFKHPPSIPREYPGESQRYRGELGEVGSSLLIVPIYLASIMGEEADGDDRGDVAWREAAAWIERNG